MPAAGVMGLPALLWLAALPPAGAAADFMDACDVPADGGASPCEDNCVYGARRRPRARRSFRTR